MKKITIKQITALLPALLVVFSLYKVPSARALPAITPFYDDLDGFNTAAGFPPVVVNFDDLAPGTDITNLTIRGVTFEPNLLTTSAALLVVRANDTYSPSGFSPPASPNNKLFATSGENVLSPGGIMLAPGRNDTLENDDLTLTFANPVSAVGFDVLFQAFDGYSFTSVRLLDESDSVLYQLDQIPIPGEPSDSGGTTFVGFVSTSNDIAKIIIDDSDDNAMNADCNIGFDTIRFSILDTTAPEMDLPSQNPPRENVQPDQSVTVSVNATDAETGIKNVTLIFSFDNGTSWETPQTMRLNFSTNLYEAIIPGQPAQTWVKFKIVAYDNAGNNATLGEAEPYFTYQVIPEFPPSLILPLFMILTMLTVVFTRKKATKTKA